MNTGIDLENQQYAPCNTHTVLPAEENLTSASFIRMYLQGLRRKTGPNDPARADAVAARLQEKIHVFNAKIQALAPSLSAVEPSNPEVPETARLLLPSSFTVEERERHELGDLVTIESNLRVGGCFDAVKKLKEALGVRSFLTRHVRTQRGYNQTTRSQDAIKRAEAIVRRWGRVYQAGWRALNALETPEEQRQGLKELKAEHLTVLGQWLEGEQYKHRGSTLPWIWSVAPVVAEEGDAEGSQNAARVESWNEEGTSGLERQQPCIIC